MHDIRGNAIINYLSDWNNALPVGGNTTGKMCEYSGQIRIGKVLQTAV